MKGITVLAIAAVAASSWSVFDLQQVSRFNSSAVVDTSFSRVVPKPGGNGFFVAGKLNEDILIVEFDNFGSVLRTQIWDSPLVYDDTLNFLGVYGDGRVLIATTAQNGRIHLVQFSPTLTQNWEISRSLSSPKVGMDGSGNAYIANSLGVEGINPSGGTRGTASIANFELTAVSGVPGNVVPGVVLVGRDSTANQPRAMRYTSNVILGYDRTETSFSAATGSTYTTVAVEGDGDTVCGGRIGPLGNTSGVITAITSAGVGLSGINGSISEYANVKIRNATEAHAIGKTASGDRLDRINRASGLATTTSAVDPNDFVDYVELAGPQRILAATAADVVRYLQSSNHTVAESFAVLPYSAAASMSANLGVLVGSNQGAGAIALCNGSGFPAPATYQFAGAATRSLLNSVKLPDGSVGMIALEEGIENRCFAVRYRPNGTLMFAKAFTFGANPIGDANPNSIVAFPDGSFAHVQRLLNNRWGFVKVSNSGVITAAGFPHFGTRQPSAMAALPDGSTAVFSVNQGLFLVYTQVSASGTILQERTYEDVTGYDARFSTPLRLNSGNILIAGSLTNNTVNFRAINPTTGVAGAAFYLGSSSQSIRTALDAAGNVVIGYDSGTTLQLERRSGSNLATILNSAAGGTCDRIIDLCIAPNGNAVALCKQVGDDNVMIYGPGAFASLSATTLPPTISEPRGLDVGATNVAYVVAEETTNQGDNGYAARFLPNGVRSAQRRVAAREMQSVFVAGSGVWLTGNVGTRKKGVGPFAARYSL